MNRPVLFYHVAALFLLGYSPLLAQTTGSISGYVRDPSGSAIVHGAVKAVSSEQQLTRSTLTDDTGYYALLALPPGIYQLTVESSGFEKQVQSGVTLTTGQSLRLDVAMKVGAVLTQVTVSSTASMVNTSNQTLSALVDDRRVQDLPLNGRNVMGLAVILPGVTNLTAPQELTNTRSGPTMSVNGGRAEDNNFTFNGANFTHFGQTTGMNYPPPDAIQEVRIQTQNFTSEYGNSSGSQISVVSKSGTNTFHATGWEFLRNDVLNARTYFLPRRAKSRQNQAGGAGGGPLKKDKLFVFGYYQRLWNRPEAASGSKAFVPSAAQRNGDFTGLSTALKNPKDPANPNNPLTDSAGRPCVQGNIILQGCLSPAAQNVLRQFIPQTADGTFVALTPVPSNNYSYMGRIDYVQSAKHKLNGHFFVDQYDQRFAPGNIQPYETGLRTISNKNYSLSSIYTLSSSFLNQATIDFMHAVSHDTPAQQFLPSSLGIAMPAMDGEGISINVNGYFNLATANPSLQDYRSWHLRDDMTSIHGRHMLKWGYEGDRLSFTLATRFQTRTASFSGKSTGDSLADFTLGIFDSVNQDFGNSAANYIGWKHFFYFQDEFKVSPRFTLTLGVRYEPYFPWYQKYKHYTFTDIGHFDVVSKVHPDALPGVRFVGDPGTPDNGTLNFDDLNNFGPRIGFAWDVFGNGKTSVRGGYGLFYSQLSANVAHQAEAPFAGTDILNQGRLDDPYGSLNRPFPPQQPNLPGNFGCVSIAGFPGLKCAFPIPANLVSTDPRLVTPYTHSISLTVERQVMPDLVLEISYAGKLSRKLEGHHFWDAAVLKPDPRTGSAPSAQNASDRVYYTETIGLFSPQCRLLGNFHSADYHSAQLRVNKRLSKGFSVLGSYVFSKAIDDVVNFNAGVSPGTLGLTPGEANPFNPQADRGRGSFDHTHVLSLSWLWTQSHKFSNPLAKHFLEDWSLAAIHSLQSGAPLEITMGSDVGLNGSGQGNLELAQFAPGMSYADARIAHPNRQAFVTRFFNPAAFVPIGRLPTTGIYGNAGRNVLNGPAYSNIDFTLMKDIAMHERLKVQLRGEFFNAFNQVNFNPPESRVSAGPSFGKILTAQPARVVQLALKLMW